jgi:hypothetical protein
VGSALLGGASLAKGSARVAFTDVAANANAWKVTARARFCLQALFLVWGSPSPSFSSPLGCPRFELCGVSQVATGLYDPLVPAFAVRDAPAIERRFGTCAVVPDSSRGANCTAFQHALTSVKTGGFRKLGNHEVGGGELYVSIRETYEKKKNCQEPAKEAF